MEWAEWVKAKEQEGGAQKILFYDELSILSLSGIEKKKKSGKE